MCQGSVHFVDKKFINISAAVKQGKTRICEFGAPWHLYIGNELTSACIT